MNKQITSCIILLLSILSVQAQIVDIPDPALKDALVNQIVVDTDFDGIFDDDVDTNNDGEVQVSEALAVEVMGLIGKDIFNMRGIEAFQNLRSLIANYNNYDQIDVSNMADLEVLVVSFCELETLNVSQNPALRRLEIDFNHIESIDLANNTALERLWLTFNDITELDLSANVQLQNLNADSNDLSNLDLSANTSLEYLAIDNNQLTQIDLSANPGLVYVDVYGNQLESLDVSFQSGLTFLTCLNNNLNYLNIQNGNNAQLDVFNALNNPDLSCIQVDDVSVAQDQEDWQLDGGIQFSEDCLLLGIGEQDAIDWTLMPNPANERVWIRSQRGDRLLGAVRVTDLSGRLFFSTDRAVDHIDLAGWPSGLYFVAVTDGDGGRSVSKLLKQ